MQDTYFEDETFSGLDKTGQTFSGLTFVDCTFEDCAVNQCTLVRCSFSGCTFRRCTVSELHSQLSQVKNTALIDCSLTGLEWSTLLPIGRIAEPISKLDSCRLRYNQFTEMNLKRFDFSGSQLTGCIFADCDLADSRWKGCKLDRTEYIRCDLRKADFRDATGYQIDILTGHVKGARFSFPEAIRLLDALEVRVD